MCPRWLVYKQRAPDGLNPRKLFHYNGPPQLQRRCRSHRKICAPTFGAHDVRRPGTMEIHRNLVRHRGATLHMQWQKSSGRECTIFDFVGMVARHPLSNSQASPFACSACLPMVGDVHEEQCLLRGIGQFLGEYNSTFRIRAADECTCVSVDTFNGINLHEPGRKKTPGINGEDTWTFYRVSSKELIHLAGSAAENVSNLLEHVTSHISQIVQPGTPISNPINHTGSVRTFDDVGIVAVWHGRHSHPISLSMDRISLDPHSFQNVQNRRSKKMVGILWIIWETFDIVQYLHTNEYETGSESISSELFGPFFINGYVYSCQTICRQSRELSTITMNLSQTRPQYPDSSRNLYKRDIV